MSYCFAGLIVSVIMKYADNMVKIYAVAVSMALTMILSIMLFPEYKPSLQLLYGIIIITISILQYFNLISMDNISAVISTPTPPAQYPVHQSSNSPKDLVVEINNSDVTEIKS